MICYTHYLPRDWFLGSLPQWPCALYHDRNVEAELPVVINYEDNYDRLADFDSYILRNVDEENSTPYNREQHHEGVVVCNRM